MFPRPSTTRTHPTPPPTLARSVAPPLQATPFRTRAATGEGSEKERRQVEERDELLVQGHPRGEFPQQQVGEEGENPGLSSRCIGGAEKPAAVGALQHLGKVRVAVFDAEDESTETPGGSLPEEGPHIGQGRRQTEDEPECQAPSSLLAAQGLRLHKYSRTARLTSVRESPAYRREGRNSIRTSWGPAASSTPRSSPSTVFMDERRPSTMALHPGY